MRNARGHAAESERDAARPGVGSDHSRARRPAASALLAPQLTRTGTNSFRYSRRTIVFVASA
jgi:hypothetical protein